MQDRYDPAQIEGAAQQHWQTTDAYRTREEDPRFPKGKFYACSMLPYPSGKLHMGHVRNYTINDMMARYMRMRGYNVLMPMGWDAFGLPAENAAIDKKVAPAVWTRANIAEMKAQMRPLGLSIDWSREIATCDAEYYKWNQWFFLKMLERGIAYKKTQVVNWDPVDMTVLANEQVVDGKGWRSGVPVEKREIPGYYLGITQYADELLAKAVEDLEGWPERVRAMQEHWIGKSEGVRFAFTHDVRNADGALIQDGKLWVFTTRADTIMGVTFCAVALEHPLAVHAARTNPAIAGFIETAKAGGTTEAELALKDKEGVATGLFVVHPLTGEKVEVWVGNYVLMTYGDGAVMGVPAHDERDFAFAKKYGLPIKQVVARAEHLDRPREIAAGAGEIARAGKDAGASEGDGGDDGRRYSVEAWQEWYGDKQTAVCVNSGMLDGLAYRGAVDKVAQLLAAKGLGEKKTTYRLRDWGISRQRYWGTPIPIIHCGVCGAVPVPYKDLPVVLPEHHVPDGSGNPLNKDERFLSCQCPQCGKPARRETDTMDTFVDSAWYYMRYCSPDASESMVDARNDYWMPMDQYIGGIEHAVLHLLYARFWTKAMRDLGLVKFDEPFTRLFTQGMLLAECFYREEANGKRQWFYPAEVVVRYDDKGKPLGATARADGQPVLLGGIEKMSKSKNNVVEPGDIIQRFGADTARAYVMFAGPPVESAVWSDSGAEGVHRFLKRVWAFAFKHVQLLKAGAGGAVAGDARVDVSTQGVAGKTSGATSATSAAARTLRREIHLNLRQADADYARLQYNTVVSACMKMLNALEGAKLSPDADAGVLRECFGILLRMMYPATPHIAHALWNELGYKTEHGEILDAPWPAVDEGALVQDEIEMVVQVNGKLRGTVRVPAQADRAAIEAAALADERVAKFVTGTPKKIIVVPGKLVNVVV